MKAHLYKWPKSFNMQHDSVRHILHLTFQNKEPSWGLMITLVAFTLTVAAKCIMLGGNVTDAEGLVSAAAETMLQHRGIWLVERGGWENMLLFPPRGRMGPD